MSSNRTDTSNIAPLAATSVLLEHKESHSEKSGQSGTALSLHQSKATMTAYLSAFVREFKLLTAQVEPIYNPLSKYGDKTDSNEGLINTALTTLNFRTAKTYILDGDPNIEFDLQTNKYKTTIDAFLEDYYPRAISKSTINRSPEFIVRTIRLLLLNIEFYLKEDAASKKRHLEAVKKVCLYIMKQGTEWAKDTTLWTSLFSNNQHYFEFCDLLENLKNMLTADIKELSKSLEVNKLPASLKNLKRVEEDLSQTFPRTLLQRLLDRPVPEHILTDPRMVKLFEKESLTFHEFKASPVSDRIKAVIIDRNNPHDDSVFNLIKNVFYGATRKRLRKELASVAIKEALSQAEDLSRTISSSASRGLLQASQHPTAALDPRRDPSPIGEEPREAPSLSLTPVSSSALQSRPQTAMLAATSSSQLNFNSLSQATQEVANQYHYNLDQYASNRALIVAVLPKVLRKIYNNPLDYNPTLVKNIQAYVESFVKGFYLIEQLIHLSENLSKGIAFHPHGGNILTKQFLPLPNVRDSAFTTFTHIKTVSEELEELSLVIRNDIPELNNNFNFRLNGNQAIVLSDYMYLRIDTEGLTNLKAMHDSLSIESIRSDAVDALQNFISMTVQQIALQGMNVHISPLFRLFTPLIATTLAMADHHRLEQQNADRRYLQFVNHLPEPQRPLPLMPIANPAQISVVEEITLKDLLAAKLQKLQGLTLGQILQGEIVEELGQFYLRVNGQEFFLTPEAKQWILTNQAKADHNLGANSNAAPSTLVSQLNLLQAQDETDRRLQEALTTERIAHEAQLTRTTQLLPSFNRQQDLSAKLSKWWVPLTIVGLPFFIAAGLYRLFNTSAIKKDLQTHAQLKEDEVRLRARIQEIDIALNSHTTNLRQRTEERARLERLQQLAQQNANQRNLNEASSSSRPIPATLAPQRLFTNTVFASSPADILPPPSMQGMRDEPNSEVDLSHEREACVVALLRRLSQRDVEKLFQNETERLPQMLAPLLSKVTTNQAILGDLAQQQSIYNRVINKLLIPDRFKPYISNLLEHAQKQYKGELLKFDTETLAIALNASFDSAFKDIKNKNVKQYIVHVLAIPEIEKLRNTASASQQPRQ